MPELVTEIRHVESNIRKLDFYHNRSSEEVHFYKDTLKRGRNFVAMRDQSEIGYLFAPSRFVGYKSNDINHLKTRVRTNGSVTDKRLKVLFGEFLGMDSVQFAEIENAYLRCCELNDIKPTKYENGRRYWRFVSHAYNEAAAHDPDSDLIEDLNEISNRASISETQRKRLRQARVGQGKFRKELETFWKGCAVSGCSVGEALRASHILPWRDANDRQRLDCENGLLLLATLDALFDKGLISFDDEGKMLTSEKFTDLQLEELGAVGRLRQKPSHRQREYLQLHRKKFHFTEKP